MQKKQIDNNKYVLYSPDSLKYITDRLDKVLLSKIDEYIKLFNINKYRKITINYFDDLEQFRKFVLSMREDKNSLPLYAKGTYDEGMINAFIEKNIIVDSPLYLLKLYMANHELFHIMYLELVLDNDLSKKITWYDEGMALLLSGEKESYSNIKTFANYYRNIRSNTKVLPNINELIHGELFNTDDYNGYDLSYLSVRYLYETLSEKSFKDLVYDINKVYEYGKTIIKDAFEYYDNKYLGGSNE